MTLPRPQRILHLVPPGSLLKRRGAPAIVQSHKGDIDRDPAYLALVRQCPCLHCGMEPSEAAHVRMASAAFGKASGMGKTPPDQWALSLCSEHHRNARTAQHRRGELQWWDELGINPLAVCRDLHTKNGDLIAMRAVIFVAIAGRG
jgi:hypothetical protein